MYANMPLGQIRSSSVGPEGTGNFKDKISSLLGGNTKGSTSGKENYEDLNNEESPLFLDESYNLNENPAYKSPSALIKVQDEKHIKFENLQKTPLDQNTENSLDLRAHPYVAIV
mmetsp:Transcript_9694/g.10969  ORF Transcript_9694/g.10969 Transcript_9694/m.10969 type:complete len:114 (-) Transcript_9694:30-371(-)